MKKMFNQTVDMTVYALGTSPPNRDELTIAQFHISCLCPPTNKQITDGLSIQKKMSPEGIKKMDHADQKLESYAQQIYV